MVNTNNTNTGSRRIKSITLLGSSSGRNAGDAALMSGIMDSIDAASGSRLLYEIPTIRPDFVCNNYSNRVQPISMMPWHLSVKMFGMPTYRSIMRTDLSLVFDAILFDRSLYNPLFNFLSTLYLILPRAKKAGKHLACFNVGCGPVDTKAGRRMLKEVAECMDFITVRDEQSYDLLLNLGVKNPRILLTADAALNVIGAPEVRCRQILSNVGVKPGEKVLAININQYMDTWAYSQGGKLDGSHVHELTSTSPQRNVSMGKDKFLSVYAEALNQVSHQIDARILFVCTQHHDVNISTELGARLGQDVRWSLVSNKDYSHYEIIGVLALVDMLFAMRLHALILATSSTTPTLGIAYQPKCAHYFHSLGLDDYMMHFPDFTAPNLVSHLLRGWQDRDKIRLQLEKRIPSLRREALKAAELVAGLSAGDDLDEMMRQFGGEERSTDYSLAK